jgi:hypothetical protein
MRKTKRSQPPAPGFPFRRPDQFARSYRSRTRKLSAPSDARLRLLRRHPEIPISPDLENPVFHPEANVPADYVRELQFDAASAEVEARYKRCATHWAAHLERTRSVILRAARLAQGSGRAAVLGAGLLHDIPLAELSAQFEEVVLVDVVHSRACRLRASIYPNVRCLEADVTGTAPHLVQARKTGGPLPRITPDLFRGEPVDLVVSVNLLSQLGCAPASFLAASHAPGEIRSFQRHLVESHLAYLRHFPGHAALITDVAWSSRPVAPTGALQTARRDVLHQVNLPPPAETWDWLIAPAPESDPLHDVIAHVAAYPDWKAANRVLPG